MDNEVKIQFKNEISNLDQLEKYRDTLRNIYFLLTDKAVYRISKTSQKAKEAETETGKVSKSLDKIAKQSSIAFNYNALGTFVNKLKQLTKVMAENVNKSSTYYENLNLLQVAFKGNTTEADKFVNRLSEMYGLDESWGYRTVGIFKQLSNAMGLADETGKKVSKTMTQFAIDTSSLYNIDTNDAVSIITSALAGQTKPARRLGADITQATLQQTLINAGIDKSISKLNYAEKRLVIIASLLTQVKEATNDWGKTIESPANQTRILNEQWERLTRTLGDIFLPMIAQALPYLNAILMVLVEIGKIIAGIMQKIFKYDPKKELNFGAGVASEIEDIVDEIDGIGDSSSGAAKNVKNLKNELLGLRSFDQLINLTTPSSSSKNGTSGSGSGSGLGVSDDILNLANKAMDEYNSQIENVKMKATIIRDRIMEWLGFTKLIDEKTGEIKWKFEKITSGTVLGAFAVGGSIFIGISRIYSILKKMGIVGTGTSIITKLVAPITNLATAIGKLSISFGKTLIDGITALGKWLGSGGSTKILEKLPLLALIIGEIEVLLTDSKLHKIFSDIISETQKLLKTYKSYYEAWKPLLDSIVDTLRPIISYLKDSLATALQLISAILGQIWDSFIDILSFANEFTFEKLLFGLETINAILKGDFKGALENIEEHFKRIVSYVDSMLDSLSKKSGLGVIGYVYRIFGGNTKEEAEENVKGVESLSKNIIENTKKIEHELETLDEQFKDSLGIKEFEGDVQALSIKLLSLVEENGKVNESNRKVAQFIINDLNKALGTEYTLEDGVIKLKGKEIKSNKELEDSLQKLIDKKKIEILLDGYKQDYINALKEQKEHQEKINELNQQYIEAEKLSGEEGEKARQKIINEYKKEKEAMEKNQKTINDYDNLIKASASNNSKEIKNVIKTYGAETKTSVASSFNYIEEKSKQAKENLKKNLGKIVVDIDANTNGLITSVQNAFNKLFNGEEGQKKLSAFATIFKNVFKADGGVYAGGQWHNIQRYDGGGMPQTGQLFWARENGLPEMVGQIGGHTAVMNNDQIVGSVANGVYKATREALATTSQSKTPQIYNFYLDKNHKLATYTLEELQSMARNNGKAITIA